MISDRLNLALLETQEAQWSLLFNSPESEIWLEELGASALFELSAGLTKPLTEENL